ncbi:MAG TPA: GNAT family N-acetyltransferase, partial [Anaerolineales bacterium]|nr:GNAT family N-acetyltransferase [Anaerolineales bacterium]
ACEGGRIIGTGGIRRWEDSVCELKRLWVTWEFHGQGVGHRLMQELISIARAKGYKKMRLETNPVYQARAVAFYKKLGFREIPPYGEHPDELAMELDL